MSLYSYMKNPDPFVGEEDASRLTNAVANDFHQFVPPMVVPSCSRRPSFGSFSQASTVVTGSEPFRDGTEFVVDTSHGRSSYGKGVSLDLGRRIRTTDKASPFSINSSHPAKARTLGKAISLRKGRLKEAGSKPLNHLEQAPPVVFPVHPSKLNPEGDVSLSRCGGLLSVARSSSEQSDSDWTVSTHDMFQSSFNSNSEWDDGSSSESYVPVPNVPNKAQSVGYLIPGITGRARCLRRTKNQNELAEEKSK